MAFAVNEIRIEPRRSAGLERDCFVSKLRTMSLQRQCEAMAATAGFRKQLCGPFDFQSWMKELTDHRCILVSRPAPMGGVPPDLEWIGHHGHPDKAYWELTLEQRTPGSMTFNVLGVRHALTLPDAFALAAGLENGTIFFDPS
jgi:hypothetical protein